MKRFLKYLELNSKTDEQEDKYDSIYEKLVQLTVEILTCIELSR